ncbi:ABC transporter ATP-binding protein [Leptotrichia sp. OH3620_COT-345]|uniref:ABC transporter ATP-binding protein n=1 Tax=Leptotrichia sp. OH3620_COT-345 TaxID=2491048 RepID=UPI000F645DC2|nr:ABC transporter ATP-binding protein [Leptotrichia sp. OH3620_COT-345]RRD39745.1 ABC transporter ATP-binding protein [Leptotrichia sp. OH3620_COT-345]
MLKEIKILSGVQFKNLKKPVLLLVTDSIFYMINYMMFYFTVIDLITNIFSLNKIFIYTLIMFIANILRYLFNRTGYTGIQCQGAKIIQDLRLRMGDHLRNLNLGYFNKHNIGNIINIMTNDLQEFERVLTHSTSEIIKLSILSFYLLLVTFAISPVLGIIQLCVATIGIIFVVIGAGRGAKIALKKKHTMDDVVSRMVEYIAGMEIFKSYNLVGEKFERLKNSFVNLKKESINTEIALAPYVLIFRLITDISFALLLLFSTQLFIKESVNKIEFFSFIVIGLSLTNVLKALSMQYTSLQYMKLATDKLISVYSEREISYELEKVSFKNYDIKFDNVSFSYEKDKPVLKNISFEAKQGTSTVLVGSSGSGKTTVTNLIARFWDCQSGTITIDDIDIKKIYPEELLTNISMIFQDVYLINDTIENNIKLGKQEASREEVIEAAKSAHCHEFIMDLENGYDTIVGEKGSTLSGGEKQRISIARALLKNTPIILLDEATASLDADNEYEIRKSIEKLVKNKTVITIAHKLNTIKNYNQIIMMSDGRIEEIGTHNQLMENKRRYYKMYTEMIKSQTNYNLV